MPMSPGASDILEALDHITDDVALALKSEDVYCSVKWKDLVGVGNTPNGRKYNERSVDEWVLYILDYAEEARRQTTRGKEDAAMDTIRKITNLGVNAMKQHGAPLRHLPAELA